MSGRAGRPTNTERHRQVLDIATEVIRRRGVHATSISEIAAAAGMSKSSLFNYFASKAELIERLQDRLYEVVRDELDQASSRHAGDPVSRLRALLHIHAHHCVTRLSSPVLVAFMQQWGPTASDHGRGQVEARRRYETVFELALTDAVAAGELHARDVRVATLGLIGMITWMAMWYREDVDRPLHEVADELIDIGFDGLRIHPS